MTTKEFTEETRILQNSFHQEFYDIAWAFVIIKELYKEGKISVAEYTNIIPSLCGCKWL